KIRVWDLTGKQPVREAPVQPRWVADLMFLPDGKTLAWGGPSPGANAREEGVTYLDLATAAVRFQVLDKEGRLGSMAFSAAGRRLWTSGPGLTLTLWDLAANRALQTISGVPSGHRALALSRDGGTLAAAAGDGSVRLWDAAAGTERVPRPDGSLDQVQA